ncbi:MAG: hypothetical protein KF865_05450 [Bdellovibrionaceae bacterium]|nr:hypothetical protein [Pseudobdellovibrionaceae bacterium]
MIFALYRFVLFPGAWLIFQLGRWIGDDKWRALLRAKNSGEFHFNRLSPKELRARRPLWVHASSGEIEYARPVLREWKRRHPDIPLVVTYSSPSAVRILRQLAEIDAWGAVPWEFRGSVEKFLRRFEPRAALVARTDLWPVMADTLRRHDIPTLMFAATFAENSSRLRGLSRRLTARSLSALSELQVVSEEDKQNLGDLSERLPVRVSGDTRFDQVFNRLQNPQSLPAPLKPEGPEKILVAGSTWPEDEAVLLPAFAAAKNWKMILAPHEVSEERLAALEKKFAEMGLATQRFSAEGRWTAPVLLVDRLGVLAELYTWGDLAFVGGSFRRQVHSVMEPLAAGLRVLVGPFHLNNREALMFREEFADQDPLVLPVRDGADMIAALEKPSLLSARGRDEIRDILNLHRGATERVLRWCEAVVPN